MKEQKTAKGKRTSLKVRRRIRKTFGALFLISAILVAAIPVDNLRASSNTGVQPSVTLSKTASGVPDVPNTSPVYMTGDRLFSFAYVLPQPGATSKVGVILKYNEYVENDSGSGENGEYDASTLVISDKFDAFLFFKEDLGGSTSALGDPVAVNELGDFLFYKAITEKRDAFNNIIYEQIPVTKEDEYGNPYTEYVDDLEHPVMVYRFVPCYAEKMDVEGGWNSGKKGGAADTLYYRRNPASTNYEDTNDFIVAEASRGWLKDVPVQYIGSQSIGADGKPGAWITPEAVDNDTASGVFADLGAFTKIVFPASLKGIGDYAFYQCSSLKEVTFSTNLNTLGNHAFEGCVSMSTVTIPTNCNLKIIGDHAFYNCKNLKEYKISTATTQIGDGAFENCENMVNLQLYYTDGTGVTLNKIGNHAFRGCKSLTKVVFPDTVTGPQDIGILEGCESLESVTMINRNAYFINGAYTIDQLKKMVGETFYFEAEDTSDENNVPADNTLQKLAHEKSIAFKYLNRDIYEMVQTQDIGGATKRAVYRVNSSNQLIYCKIDPEMTEIVIPGMIGPYKITVVNETSFKRNCHIRKVIIPSTVETIAENAFLGCHNLTDIIFQEPVNITAIGNNAFQTQMVDMALHQAGCPMKGYDSVSKYLDSLPTQGEKDAYLNPKLTFTGPIGNNMVYNYAMDEKSKVNHGSQNLTYITYYSGWPSNLTVRYNPDKKKKELINYPILSEMVNLKKDDYPYLTDDYLKAAVNLYADYSSNTNLTEYERDLLGGIQNIVLPDGIEAVEDGLFARKELNETPNINKSITTYGINTIPAKSFSGCKNLTQLSILGNTYAIGDYAFENCEKLQTVEISNKVTSLGARPFAGCPILDYVSFEGGNHFVCQDSIIYAYEPNDTLTVVECLEGRGSHKGTSMISGEEMEKVAAIRPEAFYNCYGIGSIDLSTSSITEIPVSAFETEDMTKSQMFEVKLPETCRAIQQNAFKNNRVRSLDIPASVAFIEPSAFNTNLNSPNPAEKEVNGVARGGKEVIEFYCPAGSNAEVFANMHGNINTREMPVIITFTVTFYDKDGHILETQEVVSGEDAVAPEPPEVEGYKFVKWDREFACVGKDLDIQAIYREITPEEWMVLVEFYDEDGTFISDALVEPGENAVPPVLGDKPDREFQGWIPGLENILVPTKFYAQYKEKPVPVYNVFFLDYQDNPIKIDHVREGEDAIPPAREDIPERQGYAFAGWRPDYTNVTGDLKVYAQYEIAETIKYKVEFLDYQDNAIKTEYVTKGEDATPPHRDDVPERPGYVFTGWRPEYTNVTADLKVYAQYETAQVRKFVVQFVDFEDHIIKAQQVEPGEDATPPHRDEIPERPGYVVTGWRPSYQNVQSDLVVYAQYEVAPSPSPSPDSPSPSPDVSSSPAPSTDPNTSPSPGPSSSPVPSSSPDASSSPAPSDDPNASPSPSPTPAVFHTLTVKNGSGSGSYVVGAQVIVIANNPTGNQQFDSWAVDPGTTAVASKETMGTVLTMPDYDVTMTAVYKTVKVDGNNQDGVVVRPAVTPAPGKHEVSSTGSSTNNGTTVVVNKNGLSNSSCISAVINGSSDNFVVKIQESAVATERAIKALMNYFPDLSYIAYFPVDISLYDAEGENLIVDTTGLSISVTLPIPDSMISYAGNNRVAYVGDERLEDLKAKFTTINGVPCMTFNVSKFNPASYCIYVDTQNLTQGEIKDNTPKTGDGIHPKWFLSFGLLCISMVLFLMKDKKQMVKA